MNIKKQIKKTINGTSKKAYKLTSNKISVRYFCYLIKIESLFKDTDKIEEKLENYCKVIRISKLYSELDNKNLNVDKIIFLSKFYFKKTGRYYYFSPKNIESVKDLRNLIDFYLNEVKSPIGNIFTYIKYSNFIEAYKYLKSKNIDFSNKVKYQILQNIISSNYADCNYYFFIHSDFKESLISYLHLNYHSFYYDLDDDKLLFYKGHYLLKLLKKAYENNNKYNDFMNIIVNEIYYSNTRDIFDALEIPRKHIYIATKDVPNNFFSKKHPDPRIGIFC